MIIGSAVLDIKTTSQEVSNVVGFFNLGKGRNKTTVLDGKETDLYHFKFNVIFILQE